jgi:two-component system NtrC family response regulator
MAWNIRELENTVQRAVIMARGQLVEADDLGIDTETVPEDRPSLREARGRAERQAVVDALIKTRGNISQAAKHLGVSRPTFHALLDKFEVNAKTFASSPLRDTLRRRSSRGAIPGRS